MTDEITLKLDKRDVTGKAVRALRRSGVVPAVIHDHGKPSVVVSGAYLDVLKAYRQVGKHHTVKLSADGHTLTALIKHITFDPRRNEITHVVFNAVKANEKVQTEVPIRPRYDEGNDSSPAERAGYIIISNSDSALVEATPSNLPDVLEYDAEKLIEIGDKITIGDLHVPSGVEVKVEPETTIATVFEPSALAAANEPDENEASADDETAEESVPADNATTIQEPVVDEKQPGGKKELPEDGTQKTAQ